MPRSNRSRGRRATQGAGSEDEELDLSRALTGRSRSESGRDGSWNVQSVAAASSSKAYTCPGCGLAIAARSAHTVAWRADGLMGEADDLAARRHWHDHCWKIR